MGEYTQGVCHDGAAIQKDGQMMTIEEVISELREIDQLRADVEALKAKIEAAADVAANYAYIDGAYHKNWVINEMITALIPEKREECGWNDHGWIEECIAP